MYFPVNGKKLLRTPVFIEDLLWLPLLILDQVSDISKISVPAVLTHLISYAHSTF